MTDLDPREDCMWCAGNGRLETYTIEGDVDESTACVCVVGAERDAALAECERLSTAYALANAQAVAVTADFDETVAERDAAVAECERFRASWKEWDAMLIERTAERDAAVARASGLERELSVISYACGEAVARADTAEARLMRVSDAVANNTYDLRNYGGGESPVPTYVPLSILKRALVESEGDTPK